MGSALTLTLETPSKPFLECVLLASTTSIFALLDILVSRKDVIRVLLKPETQTLSV